MKRAVVTINLGDFLCENSRSSFQAAAKRWDAEYVEFKEKDMVAGLHIFFHKFLVFHVSGADRVLYIDSDAIIRGDAPSPFDLCPPEKMGVVFNQKMPRLGSKDRETSADLEGWSLIEERLGKKLKMTGPYFNAGFMILTRKHHEKVLHRTHEIIKKYNIKMSHTDQTFFNFAARETGAVLHFMDYAWNDMHPHSHSHWDYMESYVYHFAASGDRKMVMPFLEWRYPPGPGRFVQPKRVYFSGRDLSALEQGLKGPGGIEYTRDSITRTGYKGNVVSHGPYCWVARGRYRLELEMEVTGAILPSLISPVIVKLTSSIGERLIGLYDLNDFKKRGDKYEMTFSLDEDRISFEVVTIRAARCWIVVKGFTVERIADEPGPDLPLKGRKFKHGIIEKRLLSMESRQRRRKGSWPWE